MSPEVTLQTEDNHDLFEIVEHVLGSLGWQYDRESYNSIQCIAPTRWGEMGCLFACRLDPAALHFSLTLDVKPQSTRKAVISELVMLMNEQLWLGHFDFWIEDEVIIFRHALPLAGRMAPGSGEVQAVLTAALQERRKASNMARLRIALIGAGRMGTALTTGWLSRRAKPEIILVDPAPSDLVQAIADEEGLALNTPPTPVDVLVIAVKPQAFETVAKDLDAWIGPETLVISIMAGIRLKRLAETMGTQRVLRAMPNTPGSIGQGVTVISAPDEMTQKDIDIGVKLLKPLGMVEGPVPEALMSAVTAVSGSGPAYLFLLVEALASAGEAEGLSPDMALLLATETIIGAAALLEDSGQSPEALRKAVTSKGGTTEAALDILMRGDGIPSLMREAVRTAATRERALSAGK